MTLSKITETRENAQRLTKMSIEKEESKKTAIKSKALSQDLCSVQDDLSRYQKRQNCIKFEVLIYEVIWSILVCRLKLFRSLSRSEQVKLY
jgi:hypothetical protein